MRFGVRKVHEPQSTNRPTRRSTGAADPPFSVFKPSWPPPGYLGRSVGRVTCCNGSVADIAMRRVIFGPRSAPHCNFRSIQWQADEIETDIHVSRRRRSLMRARWITHSNRVDDCVITHHRISSLRLCCKPTSGFVQYSMSVIVLLTIETANSSSRQS